MVRPVEGKNQYADSLSCSKAVIEGFQRDCPGFPVDGLRQRISREFGNKEALAHIISRLSPFDEQVLRERAEQRRRAELEKADARAASYNPRDRRRPRY